MSTTKYKILQLDYATPYRFMPWSRVKRNEFSLDDYSEVWRGEKDVDANASINMLLEELFEEFNLRHPLGYRGRSMSCSDIIVIDSDSSIKYYYVDRFGFKDITSVIA